MVTQLSFLDDTEEFEKAAEKVAASKSVDASPWTDWKIARDIEDAAYHWRVVGAYRPDRVRGLTDEQRAEIDAELDAQGYRNDRSQGKWPDGKTPDRMIAERIGITRFDPNTGGAVLSENRKDAIRYARVTRYLMPFLNARIPGAIKRGRDNLQASSVIGPMLVECVAWWYDRKGEWPGPEDFDDDELPPLEFVERFTNGVDELVTRTKAFFN